MVVRGGINCGGGLGWGCGGARLHELRAVGERQAGVAAAEVRRLTSQPGFQTYSIYLGDSFR